MSEKKQGLSEKTKRSIRAYQGRPLDQEPEPWTEEERERFLKGLEEYSRQQTEKHRRERAEKEQSEKE